MGAAQSQIPSEVVVAAAIIAGAAGVGYSLRSGGGTKTEAPSEKAADSSSPPAPSKKAKKKKSSAAVASPAPEVEKAAAPEPKVVGFPDVIPGQFEVEPVVPDVPQTAAKKKQKKKKGKSAASGADTAESRPTTPAPAPATTLAPPAPPAPKSKKAKKQQSKPDMSQSFAAVDTDGEWTRVESRRGKTTAGAPAGTSASETGATSSITGTESPVAERTEAESEDERPKTLAEKLVPKAPKTGVADMLETPDDAPLARVMRVTPRPDEKPASGFSWGDYEDVAAEGGGNDADGEDDGWGVVKSRGRSKQDRPTNAASTSQSIETLSKRQRQNAKKREVQKEVKAQAEAERLANLAKHKRELEKARMVEQYAKSSKGKQSGGMTASVDEHGKLVWE
ncbi:hypothetical protein HDZ31DRAFT_36175 [Schizophyllum fasciatum]